MCFVRPTMRSMGTISLAGWAAGKTERIAAFCVSGQGESVRGALHPQPAAVHHMRVNHRRSDVAVTQQLLHGPDVVAALDQVGCKGVPEGVATRALRYASA